MSNKKLIAIGLIITVIVFALWFIFRKPKEQDPEKQNVIEPVAIKFPLKLGSQGQAVKQVQKYLNSKGAKLNVDGEWGGKTNDAALLYIKRDNISEEVYYKWSLDKI